MPRKTGQSKDTREKTTDFSQTKPTKASSINRQNEREITSPMKDILEESQSTTTSDGNIILEQNQQLSQSLLWKLQRNYFEHQGIKSWSQGIVPQYITTNSFIAKAYSNIVLGFLRDSFSSTAATQPDKSQPFYIIELGSGSGRFAYHFLKHFLERLGPARLSSLAFQYVITDFSMSTLEFLQKHPQLQPFVKQGILDFAHFDVELPQDLTLLSSGKILSATTVSQPVILIANYVFDSVPQDCFTIQNGQLTESLLTVSTSQEEIDLNDPLLLTHAEFITDYHQQPTSVDYYDDRDFNQILETYQEHLAETTFLFPHVALRCLRYFCTLSRDHLLLLSADKSYTQEASLLWNSEPSIALHGSFSLIVNYHAIGEYFCNQGGLMLKDKHDDPSLQVIACLTGHHPTDYFETTLAFREAVEQWSPRDFCSLRQGIKLVSEIPSVEGILAYLKLSGWDGIVFLDCFSALSNQVTEASKETQFRIYGALQQIWNMYYHIGEETDLPFHLGVIAYRMEYYAEAMQYFQYSLSLYGPDSNTFYNISQCHYYQRHWKEALVYINQTLELNPKHQDAKNKKLQIQIHLDNSYD